MLAWLDLITGAHHREVCAQYESRLLAAADRIREAEARELAEREQRRALEQEFVEHIFPRKQVASERHHPISETTERAVDIPIDPNDDAAMIRQAMRETGSRNGRVVMARAQRMKDMALRGERVTQRKRITIPQQDVEKLIQDTLREGERQGIAAVAPQEKAG
jgi:hypothetical protein